MDDEKRLRVVVFTFLPQATSLCFSEPTAYNFIIISHYILIVYLTKLLVL